MTARQACGRESFLPPRTLRRLLQEQPTPFYLYDTAGLAASCRAVYEAFSWNRGFCVYVPVRMNPNPAVLEIFRNAGCGAVCGSETELLLAKRAGFSGQTVLYAPMAYQESGAGLAKKLGAAQLIDNVQALAPYAPELAIVSVNPGGGLRLDGRTVWNFEKCKLGMTEAEAFSLCRQISAHAAEVGLGICLRDQEPEALAFYAAAEYLFRLAVRVREELGIAVGSIFLSGGLGACYRASDQPVNLTEVSRRIKRAYEEILMPAGLAPRLLLSPGRLLLAPNGMLVSRVIAVKQQKDPTLILDADCAQFLREIAFGASHRMSAPLAPEGREKRLVRVAGALFDMRDHFSGTALLPELKLGECVVIHDAGADGRSFASNYAGSLGCAEFLLEADGSVRQIRRRQSPEELLAAFEDA